MAAHADPITYYLKATPDHGLALGAGSFILSGAPSATGVSTFSQEFYGIGGGPVYQPCGFDCVREMPAPNTPGNTGTGGSGSAGGSGSTGGSSNVVGYVGYFELDFNNGTNTASYSLTQDLTASVTFTDGVLTDIEYMASPDPYDVLKTGTNAVLINHPAGLGYQLDLNGRISTGVLSASLTDPGTANLGTPLPAPAAVTPEPSSLVLLGTGVLGMAAAVRRRIRLG